MISYLRALLSILPGWLAAPLRPLTDRLVAIWQWAYDLGRRTVGRWALVTVAGRVLLDGLHYLAFEAYSTLAWLSAVSVPRWARWARDLAISVMTATVVRLLALRDAAIAALRTWAILQIGLAARGLADLRRWAVAQLAGIMVTLTRLVRHVFGVLGTPERLAAWIVGAMWTALWRYGYSQRDRLAAALWARRQPILLRSIVEIERIIGRLL